MDDIFNRLSHSKFRSSFKLKQSDIDYINKVGIEKIEEHAFDFISTRIAPKYPKNDGKQTPFRNHPVFIAQHACAICCRGCLEKWYGISRGKELSKNEIDYLVNVIMTWIKNGGKYE